MNMAKVRMIHGPMTAMIALIAVAVVFGLGAVAANAQGPGGPQLSSEDREAAWELQAKGVAKDLGLADDAAAKLVDAYKTARRSHQEALAGLAGGGGGALGGGGGAERFQAFQKLNEEHRAKLKEALSGVLNEEQAGRALASLGTFSRQWDRLVDTLAGYGLDGEKQAKGLSLIAAYVVEADAAMAKAREGGDFQAIRTAAQGLKDKLDTSMADVLSAEQLAQWKTATVFRGGRGGPGRGPEGGAGQAPTAGVAPGAPPAGPGAEGAGGQRRREEN
jgi:hypothetical protein